MSQQLTTSATGGLLALNPSTSLQGPTSVGGEGALFSGFGALLTQQSSSSGTASEFHDGVFLPQTGIKLPSAVGEDAAEAATVQQQMLYIAQMLEQQAEGDVSPEVSAELAKALKQYVDQKPVIPPELEGHDETSEVVELLPAEGGGKQTYQAPEEYISSELDRVTTDLERDSLAANRNVTSVDDVEADLSMGGQKALVDEGAKASVNGEVGSQQHQAQLQSQTQPLSDAAPKVADVKSVDTERPVEKIDQSRQMAAQQEQQQNVVVQNEASAIDKVKSMPADVVSGSGTKPDNVRTSKSESVVDVDRDADMLLRREAFSSGKADKADLVASGERNLPPVDSVVKLEGATKLMHEPAVPQKFESALEMSQHFLQKVTAGDKAVDTGFNQRMESLVAVGQQAQAQPLSAPTQAQKTVSDAQNFMMPQHVKFNTPAWNTALGERAIMISAQNNQVAQIQLDPPELGSLSVRVNLNQDQVSLSFTSPHAHVRDAVEQSLPRLREMFAEQGLALQDSSVSDQSAGQQQRESFSDANGSEGGSQYAGGGSGEVDAEVDRDFGKPVSLVDYYA